MVPFTISLLGSPQISLAGRRFDMRVRKELALLAFLAVEQQRSHGRETLADLLWPDTPEERARNNLRVTLANLRRLLGAAGDACIHTDRLRVQFVPASAHELDVMTFRALMDAVKLHVHTALERCAVCVARLAEAADLYQGDFLADFSLPDSERFEDWATVQREQLRQQQLAVLDTLAWAYELQGNHGAQVAYGRRQLALEPWRESAHAQVIRGLWAAGQRGAALEQYEACRSILAAELGLEPSSELAALAAQLRSAAAQETAPSAQFPAPSAAKSGHEPIAAQQRLPPSNLPAALTPLVGREQELAHVEALLARPGSRLVTLIGPGGIGKTTLALELARRQLPSYQDGSFLVELAPLRRPGDLAATILQSVGEKAQGGQTPETALLGWLRKRHVLLLLDNVEHLLTATPLIGELLAATAGLVVLATSREALTLYGEQCFTVPPLALPPGAGKIKTADISQYAAVAFFVQRLQAVRPDFALSAENALAVAAFCARLDGLPLALELAAARGRHLSPQRMLEHLQQGTGALQLLAGGARGQSARQQTMHATITWSYELLSAAEQGVFRRLAVFVGGWSEEAAEAVAAAGAHLYALVDKSLVTASERADGEPRYTMLETIREYALDQLESCGEAGPTRERHRSHYLALAELAEQHLFAVDQGAWLDRLALEHDNLRAVFEYAIAHDDAHTALRLVTALRSFWYTRGHYHEGRERTLRALALPSAHVRSVVRASALNAAGALLWTDGDKGEALRLLEEALAIGRAIGDELNTGWALLHIGMIAYQQGDYSAAKAPLERGLAHCRASGPPGRRGVAWALSFLGDLALHDDQPEQAGLYHAESVALLREFGDHGLLAYPLRQLGHLALRKGDVATARHHYRESLQLNLAIQDRLAVLACLAAFAAAALSEGQAIGGARQAAIFQRASGMCITITTELASIGASLWMADAELFAATLAAIRAYADEHGPGLRGESPVFSFDELVTEVIAWEGPDSIERQGAGAPRITPGVVLGHTLPTTLTSLRGREPELETITGLLRRHNVRLVSVIGQGGIGKTRLALAAAQAMRPHFANNVWWVPLAGVEPAGDLAAQADLLAVSIANGGERSLAGRRPLVELGIALAEGATLVVLDNCEHLPVVATVVRTLLEAAPRLCVLATSRSPLGATGERLLRLDGLPVPADDVPDPAGYPAVQLFLDQAMAQAPGWAVDATALAEVVRLCRLLNGMPLGIELAAHWVSHYTPAEIAATLEEAPDLLASRSHDVPERQRSLRAAFAYSWRLLPQAAREALARLTVFRGGFDRAAAQAVVGVDVPTLAILVDASLVRQAGVGQYSLHELLRQFAADELAALERDGATTDRHARYYLRLLAHQEAPMRGPQPREAAEALSAHADNIRQAWYHALSRQQWQILTEAVHALALYYRLTGMGQRALQLLDMVADQLAVDGIASHQAGALVRRSLGATLEALRAYFLSRQARYEEAIDAARAAAAEARALGDGLVEALAVLHEAMARGSNQAHGVLPEAVFSAVVTRLERVVGFCRSHTSSRAVEGLRARAIVTECLFELSRLLNAHGRYQAALARCNEALLVCRQMENRHLEARIIFGAAEALESMGRYSEARPVREQALDLARRFGSSELVGYALNNLAGNLLYLGDFRTAYEYALASYQLQRELGANAFPHIHTLSWICFHQGEFIAALEHADNALAVAGEAWSHRSFGLLARGDALGGLGRWEEAKSAYAVVLALGRRAEAAPLIVTALAGLSRAALARGEIQTALRATEEILPLLAAAQPASVYEPLRTYETCYRSLAACDASRAAEVLRTAYRILMQQAAWIDEPEWQRSFLENIASHRAIRGEAERLARGSSRARWP